LSNRADSIPVSVDRASTEFLREAEAQNFPIERQGAAIIVPNGE
jgi:hypothetical protein